MKIIDLSCPIEHEAVFEPTKPKIKYSDHREGAQHMKEVFDVDPRDLVYSGGLGWASEHVELTTHTGTHVDAPYHYHPISEGKRARTIDELPLEWFFNDAFLLDFTHMEDGEEITVKEVKKALDEIDHEIKQNEICLAMTGAYKKIKSEDYFKQPGFGRESTLWLIEQGVKVMGIDAYTWDRPFKNMREDYKESKNGEKIWPAHFAGIDKEYCQIEKLGNLEEIPKSHGFKVACFPVKISKATAGWCRAVAIIEDE